ncbi:MAG: AAA family ATPase [Deltaproteobacteria bacterium]|jgi:hypothetical protein|nr:AAA family ATPase [Deltaproteobacteria bacterium]
MKREPWLKHLQEIPGAGQVKDMLHARAPWQIHSAETGARILIAKPGLMDRWTGRKLAGKASVRSIALGDKSYKYFVSPPEQALAPLASQDIPRTRSEAFNLAMAFVKSRRLEPDTSFSRAVYSGLFNSLLPVPGDDGDEDELVFGTWLAGGLSVSVRSFTQLANLVDFLPPDELAQVIWTAGMDIPPAYMPGPVSKAAGQPPLKGPGPARNARPAKGGERQGDRDLRQPGGERQGDRDLRRPGGERRPQEPRRGREGERPARPRGGAKRRDPLPRRARGPAADKIFRLPGRKALESFFNEHIVEIILSPDKYKKLGVDFPAATILHGPPGTGKTYAVDRLVEFIEWPVNYINSSTVASPYIHDTSKKISQVFDKAIKNAPSILVIDEMEAYLSSRQMLGAHQHQVEEVGEFLRRIPEALDRKVLIIGMTNMMESIDQAILRQGRFDYKIKIELPTREEVQELLEFLFSSRPYDKDLDLGPAVETLTGKPLSDAAFVVREASRLAARAGREAVDAESLAQAIRNIPPSKLKKDIGFLTS